MLSVTKRRALWSLAKPACLPAQVNASSPLPPSLSRRRTFDGPSSRPCYLLQAKGHCNTLKPLPQTWPALGARQTWCQKQRLTPHDGPSSSLCLSPKTACPPSLPILMCKASSVHGTDVWPVVKPAWLLARGIGACGSAVLVCIGGVGKPESLFFFSCGYLVR